MPDRTYALISDIHANLPALESVLADIESKNIDRVFHLGDLGGYAPWPNECVSLLERRGILGVAGNYDSTIANDYRHCGCRADTPRDEELSHVSFDWTRKAITADTKKLLGALPFRIDFKPLGGHAAGPAVMLFHATPVNNLVYVTADRPDSFLTRMAQQAGAKSGDVICFGHTHRPWHRIVDGIHFVNTGSVGRPNDGDPRACWVRLSFPQPDPVVEFIRVSYDVGRATIGIQQAGLPVEFARHLETGGSPKQQD